MPVTQLPLVYIGQDSVLAFTMSPEVTGGITTWSLRFMQKRYAADTVAELTKTTGSGITITGDQTFEVLLTAAETALQKAGEHVISVWRTNSGLTYPVVEDQPVLYVDGVQP